MKSWFLEAELPQLHNVLTYYLRRRVVWGCRWLGQLLLWWKTDERTQLVRQNIGSGSPIIEENRNNIISSFPIPLVFIASININWRLLWRSGEQNRRIIPVKMDRLKKLRFNKQTSRVKVTRPYKCHKVLKSLQRKINFLMPNMKIYKHMYLYYILSASISS